MIVKLKTLVNSQFKVCKQNDLDVDENQKIESSQIMEQTVTNITMLYDLCTIDLDIASS